YDGTIRSIKLPSNNKTIHHFSEKDLYGLLVFCGEKLKSSPALESHAVTMQRTGTCPITTTKILLRDVLVSEFSVSQETIRRVNFAIKANSLPGAYQAYCANKSNQELILWALREFYVRITKNYPEILSFEELTLCNKIAELMLNELKKDNEQKINEKCQTKPFPPLKGSWSKFSLLPLIENPAKIMEKKITAQAITEAKQLNTSSCQPESIISYLNQALIYFKDRNDVAGLMQLRQFMHTLEKTSGGPKDKYWDELSEPCSEEVIAKLSQLIAYNIRLDANAEVYLFEIALIAYDIAAQLAPRISSLKLGHKITLGLDDVFSDQTFFFDSITYHTIKEIVLNFMQREQNKHRIFSNAVNTEESDRTQDYIIQVLLTPELRQQAINTLKDKEVIETKKTTIEDDLLFTILMTKKCKKRDGKETTFDTEELLGKTLMNIMSLSGRAHARGKNVTIYEKYDNSDKQLYFNKNNFYNKRQLEEKFSQLSIKIHDSQVSTELMKRFPQIRSNSSFKDFAENTIFHPYEDLVKIRKRYMEDRSHTEMPYVINKSGTLDSQRLPYPCPQIDEEEDEELRSIETSPSLQVQRILEWGQYNIEKLKNDYIRMRFDQLLFQFARMDLALANAPEETIKLINKFLDKGFQFYRHRKDSQWEFTKDNPIDVIIWLSHIRQLVINYIQTSATLYQQTLSQFSFIDNKPILIEKIKTMKPHFRSSLACQLALCFRDLSKLSTDDTVTLLMANLVYHLNYFPSSYENNGVTDARCLFAEVWEKHKNTVFAMFSRIEKSELNRLINRLMKDLHIIDEDQDWILEGNIITTKTLYYTIDITKGQLTENK
ncbi:MAG: hypothetical protein H0U73_07420, partial [Tatlockia sp.]|nr:hypothetical protein [Tatlockia sp.]